MVEVRLRVKKGKVVKKGAVEERLRVVKKGARVR
jgi:hypothetical protein